MKKLIISHTCQGLVLEKILMSSEAFSKEFVCTFIPNYEIQDGNVCVATSDTLKVALGECDILIYHDISCYDFSCLLQQMPVGSLAVKIPYITSMLYWPTYDYMNPCWLSPRGATALIPWPCHKLNEFIVTLRSKQKIIDAYLQLDLTSVVDMEEIHAGQINYLRDAESGSIFNISEYVSLYFASTQLFHLINHPSLPVCLEVSNSILRHLGFAPLQGFTLDPFSNHQTPIHPSVIRYFNITWCDIDTKFMLLDRQMNFEEYVSFYIDCYIDKYHYNMFPPRTQTTKERSWPLQKLKKLLSL